MKPFVAVEPGVVYLCPKAGGEVTAIAQVGQVKGVAMWEVERELAGGLRKRMIVPVRSLVPCNVKPA